MTVKAKV